MGRIKEEKQPDAEDDDTNNGEEGVAETERGRKSKESMKRSEELRIKSATCTVCSFHGYISSKYFKHLHFQQSNCTTLAA